MLLFFFKENTHGIPILLLVHSLGLLLLSIRPPFVLMLSIDPGYSFELPVLWIACFCARICSITCCRLKEGGAWIGGNSSKLSRCRIAIPWPIGRMLKS